MDDFIKLSRLLDDGYFLIRIVPFSEITPMSIANFIDVFSIKTDHKVLLDNTNEGKHLLLLRDLTTGKNVEMITSNDKTISRANEQISFQRAPVGTLVRARCVALGGSTASSRVFHLDNLVKSLDSLYGWEFKLEDSVGAMEVVIRLDSTAQGEVEESIDKLQSVLNALAVILGVGFHIQHRSIAPVPRRGSTVSFGQVEKMLDTISPEIIEGLPSSDNAKNAASALNQAFVENYAPSRISMLWSAVEDMFTEKADPLLSIEEVNELIECANNIESMKITPERIVRLRDALIDPKRLSLIGRNRIIAKGVASVMGIDEGEPYPKVKKASALRGKHGHEFSAEIDREKIKESEKFLQEVLLKVARGAT